MASRFLGHIVRLELDQFLFAELVRKVSGMRRPEATGAVSNHLRVLGWAHPDYDRCVPFGQRSLGRYGANQEGACSTSSRIVATSGPRS